MQDIQDMQQLHMQLRHSTPIFVADMYVSRNIVMMVLLLENSCHIN